MLAFGPNWSRQPDLPLNFGPRHCKVTESTTPAEIDALIRKGIHAQDKIVFDRMEVLPKRLLEACSAAGARPIVRKKRRTQLVAEEDAGPEAASLSPEALFTQHLAANPRGANDAALLQAGLEQIRTNGTFGTTIPESKDLRFISLALDNFGPFKGEHALDLSEPGVALVLAERAGGEGGNSNGCGKSLLTAGALLFALTGHADPRPTMEGPKTVGASCDLVHHGKEHLVVCLTGSVNGVGFRITRRVSKRKPTLTFETQEPNLLWRNRTRTTMKLTQLELVNAGLLNLPDDGTDPSKAAADFLMRTVVWSQHAAPGLLEQGNDQAKKVLRGLVQAEAWEALAQRQKEDAKAYRADSQRAAHDVTRHRSAAAEASQQRAREAERSAAWEANQQTTLARLVADEAEAATAAASRRQELQAVVVPPSRASELEAAVAQAARLRHEIAAADRAIRACVGLISSEGASSAAELASELVLVEQELATLATRQSSASSTLAVARSRVADGRTKLARFEQGTAAPECAQCSQAIPSGHRDLHAAIFQATIQQHETSSSAAAAVVRECTLSSAALSQRRTVVLAAQRNAAAAEQAAQARQTKAAAVAALGEWEATLSTLRGVEGERTQREQQRRCLQMASQQASTRLAYLAQQRERQGGLLNPSGPRLAELASRCAAATAAADLSEQDQQEADDGASGHAALADLMGKNGVPNALSSRLLATLEDRTAACFESMSGDRLAFAMRFNDKGRLVKTVTQPDGHTLPMNLLSGGQFRRLQLASFMAFSEVAQRRRRVRIDLRILDEPMQSIDGAGMRAFIDAVRGAFVGKRVLLISHRPYEDSFAFDSVLRIASKSGASSLH